MKSTGDSISVLLQRPAFCQNRDDSKPLLMSDDGDKETTANKTYVKIIESFGDGVRLLFLNCSSIFCWPLLIPNHAHLDAGACPSSHWARLEHTQASIGYSQCVKCSLETASVRRPQLRQPVSSPEYCFTSVFGQVTLGKFCRMSTQAGQLGWNGDYKTPGRREED